MKMNISNYIFIIFCQTINFKSYSNISDHIKIYPVCLNFQLRMDDVLLHLIVKYIDGSKGDN